MTAEEITEARLNVKYWNQLFNEWKELDRNPLPAGGWIIKPGKNTGAGRKRSQVEDAVEKKQQLVNKINAAAARARAFNDKLETIEDEEIACVIWWRVNTDYTWKRIGYIAYGSHNHACAKIALTRWLEKQTETY